MLRLKAVVEADPGALNRVLESVDAHGVVPLCVTSRRTAIRGRSTEILEIEIDIAAADLTMAALGVIAARLGELPLVMTAVATDQRATANELAEVCNDDARD